MRPKVLILSVGITSKEIAQQLHGSQYDSDFIFHEMLLNENTRLPEEINQCDVILSSGSNARFIKNKTDKPIISISPSLYDVLLACSHSLRYCSTPVLIVHEDSFSGQDLEQLIDILTVDVIVETYDNADTQTEDLVLKYKRMGQPCIIGSGLVCEYTKKHGMRDIFLYPGESIRNCLSTASDLAVRIFQRNMRQLQMMAIVDNSTKGILLLDSQSTIILSNPVARKFFGVAGTDMAGQDISGLFSHSSARRITEADEDIQIIDSIKGRSCVIDILPIIDRKEVANRLLYIDDVTRIQQVDRDIRREAWKHKGFVAKYKFDGYQSVNSAFKEFLSIAKRFAQSDEPIVIMGETGAGKEVLAQSIHNYSKRADKAFVAVNCAAIPENLLDSELFGYSDGAFTGAKKGGKEGYFEMAHTGTIFLDEIGEMSLMLQSKLLRVIQEKQILRVGGTKLIPFDARVIVATNRNLWELVQKNTFRMDLYYRLNVLELEVPPLRELADDTLLMFKNFLNTLSPSIWDIMLPHLDELNDLLTSYSWPGNVRELENLAHSIIAYWQPGDAPGQVIALIRSILGKKTHAVMNTAPKAIAAQKTAEPIPEESESLLTGEKRQILQALENCNGNITDAAAKLGIHRSTLWRKLKRYGIQGSTLS